MYMYMNIERNTYGTIYGMTQQKVSITIYMYISSIMHHIIQTNAAQLVMISYGYKHVYQLHVYSIMYCTTVVHVGHVI